MNYTTQHDWNLLEQEAESLGIVVFAEKRGVKLLTELLVEATDEADALVKAGEKSDLSKEQSARWKNLMDEETGIVDKLGAELKAAREFENEQKRLAALQLNMLSPMPSPFDNEFDRSGPASMAGHNQAPQFRCMQTGNIITAITNDQSMARQFPNDGDEPRATVGGVLASILTGRNDFASPGQVQAAITGNDSGGGYLINPELSSQVIDLARSASVAMRAGALTVPMESSELNIARLTGDPTGYWRAEGTEVKSSDLTFDRVTLRPKMLAAIVPITIELLEDAANAASIIEQALMAALGLELDRAILFGPGSESKPKGIAEFDDVNKVAGVGTPADYTKVSSAVGDIYNANYDGEGSSLSWIMHPRDAETYDGLTDTTGQPLNPTPWAAELKRLTTSSLPTDEGAGSNESFSILGDFSQCIVGTRTSGVRVQILDSGQVTDSAGNVHNAASQLKKLIVAHLRADVALLRPTWFSLLEGITAA